MYGILTYRRLRWLGHIKRMEEGRIPKDLLYGELARGYRSTGRPFLRFKDVCKRDMRTGDIGLSEWESIAVNRNDWRQRIREAAIRVEEKHNQTRSSRIVQNRAAQGQGQTQLRSGGNFTCPTCGRVCLSRIGLFSHSRRCSSN